MPPMTYIMLIEVATSLQKLQKFLNLALNPMDRSETMSIEVYAPNNLNAHNINSLLSSTYVWKSEIEN